MTTSAELSETTASSASLIKYVECIHPVEGSNGLKLTTLKLKRNKEEVAIYLSHSLIIFFFFSVNTYHLLLRQSKSAKSLAIIIWFSFK